MLVFMASGVAAATLLQSSSTSLKPLSAAASASASATADSEAVPYELFAVACVLAAAQYAAGKRGAKRAAAAFGGAAFAASLVLSSMPKPSRVLGFLDVFNQVKMYTNLYYLSLLLSSFWFGSHVVMAVSNHPSRQLSIHSFIHP